MIKSTLALVSVAVALSVAACTEGSDRPVKTGTAGTGSGAAGTSAGAAGTGAAGTSSAAGTTAAAGSGAAGTTVGGAGTTAPDGGTDAPVSTDARGEGSGSATASSCAGHNYQLCIDFENGIDTATWTGGTPSGVVTDDAAHGTHSYRLYASARNGMPELKSGRLLSTKVGTITNQVWSRFYIHFAPGATGGHQNILAAYDDGGHWYEIGVQFDGIMGVWHGGGGETPLRSMPLIVDRWYCIEAYFDGGAAAAPKWWIDSTEAAYYMPGGGPKIAATNKFTRLEAGFTSYAGLGIKMPDGKGDQTETRVLTDLWIDDIAFDTQRIGCIQ